MEKYRIKSMTFMGGAPLSIYEGSVDVFVTFEGDDFEYWVEVATPETLSSEMKRTKETFFEPTYPFIIVRELTPVVIREAIEAFANKEEDEK